MVVDKNIYTQIESINKDGLTVKNGNKFVFISFEECAKNYALENSLKKSRCVAERDITKLIFIFYTEPKIRLTFKKRFFIDWLPFKHATSEFRELQKAIISYGYTTYDLS